VYKKDINFTIRHSHYVNPSFFSLCRTQFTTTKTMTQDCSPANDAPHLKEQQHNDPIADAKAQEATQQFVFRNATMDDVPALQKMIGESLRALGKGYYTSAELDGSIGWLFGADSVLLSVRAFHPFLSRNSCAPASIVHLKSTTSGRL